VVQCIATDKIVNAAMPVVLRSLVR